MAPCEAQTAPDAMPTADDASSAINQALARMSAEARRRAQNKEAQKRSRDKARSEGGTEIRVKLCWQELELLEAAAALQAGPREDFFRRALLTGAKFLANSGNVRGGKRRFRK